MKVYGCFFIVMFLVSHHTLASVAPRSKTITLIPLTELTVSLVPDMGTRFSFPFVLDESDQHVPFTLNITNPVFQHDRQGGRDHFVLTLPPPANGGKTPAYLGNLFISVAGYHITVLLKATNDPREHVTDYIFELSDDVRELTIQQLVEQRLQSIKQAYALKETQLDQRANRLAFQKMGELALQQPTYINIKEEGNIVSSTGETVSVLLDEVQTYGPFSLLVYDIENDTGEPIKLQQVGLFQLDAQEQPARLETSNRIQNPVPSGKMVRGVITVHSAVLKVNQHLRLVVQTNRGEIRVQW